MPCLAVPTGSNPASALPHPFYLFIFTSDFLEVEQLLFQRQHKLLLSPVLAALLEAPTGLCGFGAGQVNGCPFCAFFPISSCP